MQLIRSNRAELKVPSSRPQSVQFGYMFFLARAPARVVMR